MTPLPRVGIGIDVHPFAADGRPLRLGGITIPDSPGLAGHSDGDAVLHVLVDALLGAVGGGDIGALVGVDRPETAGADSAGFVARALTVIAEAGYAIGNVDITIVAQRPRIDPHRDGMRTRLAEILGIEAGMISVKATSTDGLGFTGRGEGIAVHAVVLVSRRS